MVGIAKTDSCKPVFQKWFQRTGIWLPKQLANGLLTQGKKVIPCPWIALWCPTCVWSNSFGRAVNDAFKKKQNRRFPDKFGSVAVSLQMSCTHKTLYCFPWQFSSCPPQSVPIFLRSFNSSQAPESKTCLFNNRGTLRWLHCWFYLKCEHVGDVMCRNTWYGVMLLWSMCLLKIYIIWFPDKKCDCLWGEEENSTYLHCGCGFWCFFFLKS